MKLTEKDARDFIEYHREIHGTDPSLWATGDLWHSYDIIADYLDNDQLSDGPLYRDVARLAWLVRQEAKAVTV